MHRSVSQRPPTRVAVAASVPLGFRLVLAWLARLFAPVALANSARCARRCHTWAAVTIRGALVVAITVLCVASACAATASARAGRVCRVPRLRGLTLTVARTRAAHAGCGLRVRGAALNDAATQTIERQSPGARARSASVTVWLDPVAVKKNDGSQDGQAAPVAVPPQSSPEPSPSPPEKPTCAAPWFAVSGSRTHEWAELEGPFRRVTPGPTELVEGFYIGGGPPRPHSR